MTSGSKSMDSDQDRSSSPDSAHGNGHNGWVRVGTIAAASALVGGLAAAWFYRKTLSRLREAEDEIPESGITEDVSGEDF